MTKEQVLDLVRAFPGRTIVASEWSDDEDVHTILLPKPDGTLERIGEEDSWDQVVYSVTEKYGYDVVLIFNRI